MKRVEKVFRLIHLVLWTLFTLLVALQLVQDDAHWFRSTAGFIGTGLYIFYGHFFILTHYAGKKNRRAYLRRLAGIVLSGPLLYFLFHSNSPGGLPGQYSLALFVFVPVFIFLSWLARLTQNLFLNTIKKEQLEKQAVEAELYYLKSQINPHFLFNTLNNIHTIVYKQAPEAPEAVLRLASLMRYMIYESNAVLVPLSRELQYLQDYTDLQQLRYKSSPVVEITISGPIAQCMIAPLLFIHLLENAYKHSPARLEAGDIRVHIGVENGSLLFSIQNPVGRKQNNKLEEPGGIGLPNVRKRLQLLYPDSHTLDINSSAETFNITLRIKALNLQPNESNAQLLYN